MTYIIDVLWAFPITACGRNKAEEETIVKAETQQHKGVWEGDCERGNYKCIADWWQGVKVYRKLFFIYYDNDNFIINYGSIQLYCHCRETSWFPNNFFTDFNNFTFGNIGWIH